LIALEELDQISLFRLGSSAIKREKTWFDKSSKDGTHAIPYIIDGDIGI